MKEEVKLTRLLRRRKQLKMAECRLSRCSFEMRKGWAELYRVLFTPRVLTTEIDTNTRGHSTPAVVVLTQIELMEFDTAYLTLGNLLCMREVHNQSVCIACALKIASEQRATDFKPGIFWFVALLAQVVQ